MPNTRGFLLEFSIAYALGRIRVRGLRGLLTEEDRHAIAVDVVRQLKLYGNSWKLDEPVSDTGPGDGADKGMNGSL